METIDLKFQIKNSDIKNDFKLDRNIQKSSKTTLFSKNPGSNKKKKKKILLTCITPARLLITLQPRKQKQKQKANYSTLDF